MKLLVLSFVAFSLSAAAHAKTVRCDNAQIAVSTTPTIEQSPAKYKKAISLERSSGRPSDLIIIGDSIAQHWGAFARRDFPNTSVINLGIGGERTQELIWRLGRLTAAESRPKAVILIIGTNNISEKSVTPCGAAAGILAAVEETERLWPNVDVFVMPILPRGKDVAFRDDDRKAVNDLLARSLQGSATTTLIAVNEENLTCRSRTNSCKNYRSDGLHLTASGYEILRDSIKSTNFMKHEPRSPHLERPTLPRPRE